MSDKIDQLFEHYYNGMSMPDIDFTAKVMQRVECQKKIQLRRIVLIEYLMIACTFACAMAVPFFGDTFSAFFHQIFDLLFIPRIALEFLCIGMSLAVAITAVYIFLLVHDMQEELFVENKH